VCQRRLVPLQAFGGVLGQRAVGRQAVVLRDQWEVAVEIQGVMGRGEHVAEGAELARGSFGTHGLSQGRIATTGCRGSTRP